MTNHHQMDSEDDDENVKQLKDCSSLYLSLQVEFSSLLDVRSVKTSSSYVVEVATKPDKAATNVKLSTENNGLQTIVKENGKVNPWEELSEALSAKRHNFLKPTTAGTRKGVQVEARGGEVAEWVLS